MKGKEGRRRGRRQQARAKGRALGVADGWGGHATRHVRAPAIPLLQQGPALLLFLSVAGLLAQDVFSLLYISKLCGK